MTVSASLRCVVSMLAAALLLAGCAMQPTHPAQTELRAHVGNVMYRLRDSGDSTPDERPSGIGPSGPSSCQKWGTESGEVFHGCARRVSKVSLVPLDAAPAELYHTVAELKQNLVADDAMRHHTPPITESATSARQPEEERNVVLDAFVYAFKSEDDRDFHLIVGDKDCNDASCFMNVEVSALPNEDGGDKDALTGVRAEFRSWLDVEPGTTYLFFVDDQGVENPVPVRIEGSLFYDLDHVAGTVGPAHYRPDTSWEVHPIRTLSQR